MSEITPEAVAEFLTAGDNEYVEDTGAKAGVYAEGPVVHVTVIPRRADRTVDRESAKHFRAVVIEGETAPIVLPRPDLTDGYEFEGGHYDDDLHTGRQVCTVNNDARPIGAKFANSILFRGSGHITTAEARRFAAALVAKADAVEAAQAEQDGA